MQSEKLVVFSKLPHLFKLYNVTVMSFANYFPVLCSQTNELSYAPA